MAILTLAQISAAFTVLLEPFIVENTNRSAVTLALIRKEDDAGQNVAWVTEGGNNDSTAYGDGDDVDFDSASSDDRKQASVEWAILGGPIQVGDLAQAVAQSLGAGNSPSELRGRFGLFMRELKIRTDKTAELINREILAGTGTLNGKTSLVGFGEIAKNGDDDTYANITPSGYDYWRAVVDTAQAPRKISKVLVQGFFNKFLDKAAGGPGRRPTHCLFPNDLWLALKQDIEKDIRVEVPIQFQLPDAEGKHLIIPGGSCAFMLDNVWCVQEPDMTPGTLFAWISEYVSLKQLPPAAALEPNILVQQVVSELIGNVQIDFMNYGVPGRASGSLRPQIKFLAEGGHGSKAVLRVYCALAALRRNAMGRMDNLSATDPG